MMNHDSSHSEYFEELCALAASGQISEREFVELQDHLEHCAHCRLVHADFTDLLHSKLPLAGPELTGSSKLAGFFSENSSYYERFLARARRRGLLVTGGPLRNTPWNNWGSWLWTRFCYSQVATLVLALLLVMVGILGYSLRQSNVRYRTMAADMAALSDQLRQQSSPGRGAPQDTSQAGLSPRDTASRPPESLPSMLEPDAELVKAHRDHAAAEARSKALEEKVQMVASELEALRTQHEEVNKSRNQLENKLAESEQTVTRVNDELQKTRRGRSEDATRMAALNTEIRQLSEKLGTQTETLDRNTALLAASRDIHDLMGARNLHIVDVWDVDSKGKDRRAFGRVFYTEEKSLIFYAFDLSHQSTAKRNASFQVWGARGPTQTPAESLGIFYVDNQKQNRWVLKFEDPRVLAEIDSVFVTVEPQGGSARPTGRKLLYAYLKTNLNHP